MKTALVTGGNRGIGEGICRVLAERGYDIFFTYKGGIYDGEEQFRNEMEKAEALVQSICNEYNVKCFCKEADFTKEEDVEKIFQTAVFCAFANTITFNEACCKSHDRKRNTGLYGEYWICKSQSGVPD